MLCCALYVFFTSSRSCGFGKTARIGGTVRDSTICPRLLRKKRHSMFTRWFDQGSFRRLPFWHAALLLLVPLLAALPAAQPVAAATCAGSFGFAPSANVATSYTPLALTAGDLNGDGRLDLVTANYGSNTLSVLLASGNAGSFAPPVDYASGSGPGAVIASDLNNDGRPDLVAVNATGQLSVFSWRMQARAALILSLCIAWVVALIR
jgi:hypothetical protein